MGGVGDNNVPGYFPADKVLLVFDGNDAPSSKTVSVTLGTLQLSCVVLPLDAYPEVLWTSSSQNVATVDEEGLVTLMAAGQTTIRAEAQDGSQKYDSIQLTVTQPVKSIEITGMQEDHLLTTKNVTLKAAVYPADATNKKIVWSIVGSDNPYENEAARLTSSGLITAKPVTAATEITVRATAADGGGAYGELRIPIVPICKSIVVYDVKENVITGTLYVDRLALLKAGDMHLALTLKALPEAAMQEFTLKSGNTRVIAIDDKGDATVTGNGTATLTITANDGSRKSVSLNVNVYTGVSSVLLSGPASIAAGKRAQLTAVVEPADASNRKVVYSIDDEQDRQWAKVSTTGLVTMGAAAAGHTVTVCAYTPDDRSICAEWEILCTATAKSVAISLDGEAVGQELRVDAALQPTLSLSASVLPSDAAQEVTWKSSSQKIATVENGVVTVVGKGTCTITATAADGSNASARFNLVSAPTLTGIEIIGGDGVAAGKSVQLTVRAVPASATLPRVTWSVDEPTIAQMNNGKVTAAGNAAGQTVVVTAKCGDLTAQRSITITNPVQDIFFYRESDGEPAAEPMGVVLTTVGQELDITAKSMPVDAMQGVVWSSSNTKVVQIIENKPCAVGVGKATLTAVSVDGANRKNTFRVCVANENSVVLITGDDTVAEGMSVQLKASVTPAGASQNVTWRSGNSALASVSSSGRVSTKRGSAGKTVTIYADPVSGVGATGELTITIGQPPASSIKLYNGALNVTGKTITVTAASEAFALAAVLSPVGSDDSSMEWSTSDEQIASVSENGTVTPLKPGKAKITARTKQGLTGYCYVSVVRAVTALELVGPDAVLGGTKIKLDVVITPADATNKKVTWKSSDTKIATVDSSGYVTGKTVQTAQNVTITATAADGSNVSATKVIRVEPTATSVKFSEKTLTLYEGDIYELAALLTLMPENAGNAVKYTSLKTSVADIDPNTGTVTALMAGTATIKATLDNRKTAQLSITVLEKPLSVQIACDKTGAVATDTLVTWTVTPNVQFAVTYTYTLYKNDAQINTVDETEKTTFSYTLSDIGSYVLRVKAVDERGRTVQVDSLPIVIEGATQANGFTYAVAASGVTVTGYNGDSATPKVCAALGGVPVTKIGAAAFEDNTTITAITLPDSIEIIGEGAFKGCTNLSQIVTE